MSIGKTGAAAVLIAKVDHWRSEQFSEPLKGSDDPRMGDKRLNQDRGKFGLTQQSGSLLKDPRICLGRR